MKKTIKFSFTATLLISFFPDMFSIPLVTLIFIITLT